MNKEFYIMTEACPALNFFIYIQNIYGNQKKNNKPRFPYMTREYAFRQNFEQCYKEKWGEAVSLVAENRFNGEKLFYDQKNDFFKGLFIDDASFNEVYQSFQVWWGSLTGQLAITRTVDDEISSVYDDLAKFSPKQNLYVEIVYDDCFLSDLRNRPYFSILTIEQCLHGKEKLLARLLTSMR
ncbi:hypothetical protein H9655_10950 [Cytobacillus sp. Sa5YUA1]|uniref:Group-specific protein n=1 Tax=Cytobacillus stercorigallinarum TaxID=2762240 RepID=A0ABR8QQ34_9BACI|nr:hypothetical protein [Cytobacillus stercorigallinarum]MBD7937542.1 hypothetical protein [Cytobacillus stercorigallinarum]